MRLSVNRRNENQQEIETTYNHAFLILCRIELIKTLRDNWPLLWKIAHTPEQSLANYFSHWRITSIVTQSEVYAIHG